MNNIKEIKKMQLCYHHSRRIILQIEGTISISGFFSNSKSVNLLADYLLYCTPLTRKMFIKNYCTVFSIAVIYLREKKSMLKHKNHESFLKINSTNKVTFECFTLPYFIIAPVRWQT
jgi:hypothetical protein